MTGQTLDEFQLGREYERELWKEALAETPILSTPGPGRTAHRHAIHYKGEVLARMVQKLGKQADTVRLPCPDTTTSDENGPMSANPDIAHGLRMGDVPREAVVGLIHDYIAGIKDLSPDDRPDVFEALEFVARQVGGRSDCQDEQR